MHFDLACHDFASGFCVLDQFQPCYGSFVFQLPDLAVYYGRCYYLVLQGLDIRPQYQVDIGAHHFHHQVTAAPR